MEKHLGQDIEAELELVEAVERELRQRGFGPASLGLVLGSGLKDFGGRIEDPLRVELAEIAGLPSPKVAGHGSELLEGEIEGVRVHILTGRVHLYEGWHPWQAVRALRALALLGTRRWLLTNAAGGLRPELGPGSLVAICDHINMTGVSSLAGPSHPKFGPRFPAMSGLWSKRMTGLLCDCADSPGLTQGVYAQMLGPSYETPAEVRMLQQLGAHAVGMSTVPEAIALHAMGCELAGLSLITNYAAGLTEAPPSHEEVMLEGERAAQRLGSLLARALPLLAQ
ncbi:MAG: purine-nucleoside phosphorylase [Planctomycetota bacterium]|nr:MAG: purine-nucleoside phosphorylase [Planctomycetota bacterium]